MVTSLTTIQWYILEYLKEQGPGNCAQIKRGVEDILKQGFLDQTEFFDHLYPLVTLRLLHREKILAESKLNPNSTEYSLSGYGRAKLALHTPIPIF